MCGRKSKKKALCIGVDAPEKICALGKFVIYFYSNFMLTFQLLMTRLLCLLL